MNWHLVLLLLLTMAATFRCFAQPVDSDAIIVVTPLEHLAPIVEFEKWYEGNLDSQNEEQAVIIFSPIIQKTNTPSSSDSYRTKVSFDETSRPRYHVRGIYLNADD